MSKMVVRVVATRGAEVAFTPGDSYQRFPKPPLPNKTPMVDGKPSNRLGPGASCYAADSSVVPSYYVMLKI